jgi:carboxyl-terminal processing protease
MRIRPRRLLWSVLVALVLATAFPASRRAAAARAPATPFAAANASPDATRQAQQDKLPVVKQAFNLLYGGYLYPLDSATLLGDAWDGLGATLVAAGVAPPARPAFTGDADADWALFSSAFESLEAAGTVSPTDLAYGAIGRMASARNSCHTAFLPPQYAASSNGAIAHQPTVFTGYVADRDSNVITRVYPDGPAAQAGLRPGDTLLTSFGQGGPDLRRRIAAAPAGAPIPLTVQRPGVATPVAITLTPELTVLPFVRTQVLPSGIGVIQFDYFTEGRGLVDAVRQALLGFEAQGVVGWVLDLRTSPGGELHTLGALASLFMSNAHVETIIDRFGDATSQDTDPAQALPVQRPLVILTEHYSASAADIFPGALQDDGRAYIIGDTTSGCVSSSREFSLIDGSMLQLETNAVLVGRDRLNLDGVGVTPDERVLRTPEILAAGEDPQMDAAVQYLLSVAQ